MLFLVVSRSFWQTTAQAPSSGACKFPISEPFTEENCAALSANLEVFRKEAHAEIVNVILSKICMIVFFIVLFFVLYFSIYVIFPDVVSILCMFLLVVFLSWAYAWNVDSLLLVYDHWIYNANAACEVRYIYAKKLPMDAWWCVFGSMPISQDFTWERQFEHVYWFFPAAFKYMHIENIVFRLVHSFVFMGYAVFFIFDYIPKGLHAQVAMAMPYLGSLTLFYIILICLNIYFFLNPKSTMYTPFTNKIKRSC